VEDRCDDGTDPHHDGVVGVAQLMHMRSGLYAGDPSTTRRQGTWSNTFFWRRGDLAVECHCRFQRYERRFVSNVFGEGLVEFFRFLLAETFEHLNPGRA